jgi:hypothetical protein
MKKIISEHSTSAWERNKFIDHDLGPQISFKTHPCGLRYIFQLSIEVVKKFPNVFGRHLISINILPKKKKKILGLVL